MRMAGVERQISALDGGGEDERSTAGSRSSSARMNASRLDPAACPRRAALESEVRAIESSQAGSQASP